MKRRDFIKTTAATAITAPVIIGGLQAQATTTLKALAQLPVDNDNILILVQLFGGNDGLNTVIPALDDEYYKLRPVIGIKKADCWNNVGSVFLHPGLAKGSKGGLARMLETGSLAIVQGVGYDNPNLSHFRSTDIWLSGINSSDPNVRLDTGWIGRFLEKRYPDFPLSLPNDPLAIQFGGFSLALMSSKGRMGIEVGDPTLQKGVGSTLDALDDESPGTAYLNEYQFVADIALRSNKYAQAVKDAYAAGKARLKGEYANNSFGNQMAAVAALIAGGLKTKVYVVSMGGFDTHVNQQTDITNGVHTQLLNTLSDGIAQLNYDMVNLGLDRRVAGMTISEFGRRPSENGSFGTDHGAASVQFVFGTLVNSGVFGRDPDLKNLDRGNDLVYSVDYREIYTEFLTDWFGMSLADARLILQKPDVLPVDVIETPSGVRDTSATAGTLAIMNASPNPFTTSTVVTINVPSRMRVLVEVSGMDGRRVATLTDRILEPGQHNIPFTTDIPAGAYLCTLRSGARTSSYPLHCVR